MAGPPRSRWTSDEEFCRPAPLAADGDVDRPALAVDEDCGQRLLAANKEFGQTLVRLEWRGTATNLVGREQRRPASSLAMSEGLPTPSSARAVSALRPG